MILILSIDIIGGMLRHPFKLTVYEPAAVHAGAFVPGEVSAHTTLLQISKKACCSEGSRGHKDTWEDESACQEQAYGFAAQVKLPATLRKLRSLKKTAQRGEA